MSLVTWWEFEYLEGLEQHYAFFVISLADRQASSTASLSTGARSDQLSRASQGWQPTDHCNNQPESLQDQL